MPLIFEPESVPLSVDECGRIRVGGTRVTLDSVIHRFRDGASAEGIVDSFDSLDLADVYATLAYYLRHRAEVDAYLLEREVEAAEVRAEIDRRNAGNDIWERLRRRVPDRRAADRAGT